MNELIAKILLLAPPILFALTLHEFAHGYVAYRLGDPTAKALGRLSLNPLRHLDPIGTLAFFLISIGWAKPVPVNGSYFKNPKQDMLWVALAGPLTNLFLAVVCAFLAKTIIILSASLPSQTLHTAVLLPLFQMLRAGVWINLVLCVFNFLPIPPLDGSRIMMGLLPDHLARTYASFERYGFILILILAFTGILSKMIIPIIQFANNLLLS